MIGAYTMAMNITSYAVINKEQQLPAAIDIHASSEYQ